MDRKEKEKHGTCKYMLKQNHWSFEDQLRSTQTLKPDF